MRKTITISIAIVLTVLISFAKDTSVDWLRDLSPEIQENFWLINHDSVAIVQNLMRNYISDQSEDRQSLQFWDLTTSKLIKKVIATDAMQSFGWVISEKFQELAVNYNNVIRYYGLNDLQPKDTTILDLSPDIYTSGSISYNKMTNNYYVDFIYKDSSYSFEISGETKLQIKKSVVYYNPNSIETNTVSAGDKIAVLIDASKVKIYNASDSTLVDSLTYGNKIDQIVLSPTGKYLGIYSKELDSNQIVLQDLGTNSIFLTLPIHYYDLTNTSLKTYLNFSADDKRMFYSSNDGYQVYDLDQNGVNYFVKSGYTSTKAQFCLNDDYIIDLGQFSPLRLIKITNNQKLSYCAENDQMGYESILMNIVSNSKNNSFYTIGYFASLSERSLDDDSFKNYFSLDFDYSEIIKSNFKDTLILYNSSQMQLWDKINNVPLGIIPLDLNNLSNPKISNDLQWIASDSRGEGLILIDAKNNKRYYLDSGRKASQAYDFSSDSKSLAEGGSGYLLKIFDLTKIEQDTTPVLSIQANSYREGYDLDSTGLVFVKYFKGNKILITESASEGLFKVWNASTGELAALATGPDSILNDNDKNYRIFNDIFYREQFDDYISISRGLVYYWKNNFEYNTSIQPFVVNLPFHTGGNFWEYNEYIPEKNKILLGSNSYGFIACVSLADPTDAVNDRPEELGCKIYPNPAHDELWIDVPNDAAQSHVEIVNLLGETVISEPFASHIIVANLSAGVYFVRIGDKMYPFVKN